MIIQFFTLIYGDETEYKCIKKDKNLQCELKKGYDFSGCTNSKLTLNYVEGVNNFDSLFEEIKVKEEEKVKKEKEKEEKAKKEKEEKDFKSSCKVYTFEELARNPEDIKGKKVKLTGEVVQAMYGTIGVDLRVNITKEGLYSTYYTDTVYVTYYPEEGENKILEDDIITIWGTSLGDTSYTSTLGATITLPYISANYISIN